MALFGKKKKAEPTAPQPTEADEIQVVGGDADEVDFDDADIVEDGGGQVIDFDAIADELDDDGESAMGDPLGDATGNTMGDTTGAAALDLSKPTSAEADAFATDAAFESGNAGLEADDELDFDSVFDDGSPNAATAAGAMPAAVPDTDENPFGTSPGGAFGDAMPIGGAPDGIAIEPAHETPPLTYTAPLLTSDAVATSGVPATRKSLPLLPLLGAAGLLAGLGIVGYLAFGAKPATEDEPIVAANPALQAPAAENGEAITPGAPVPALGVTANAVNPGIAVDGVPIAPGPVVRTALVGPSPTVPLTPALQNQLKILWKRGAIAKQSGDIAGARAAWQKMLQLRPNHPGVQGALAKLPAA